MTLPLFRSMPEVLEVMVYHRSVFISVTHKEISRTTSEDLDSESRFSGERLREICEVKNQKKMCLPNRRILLATNETLRVSKYFLA